MAVARRAAGTPVNGNVTSLTPAYPTNAVDDILVLHHVSAGSAPTTPSGWTLLGQSTTSSGARTNVFWRRVTTVLTGTQTITISPNAQSWAAITSFSGVRTSGNPYSTSSTTGGTGGGTALSAGPINALANSTSSNCFVVACIGANGARSFTSEAVSGLTSVSGSEAYDSNVGFGNSIMMWSASGTGTVNTTTSTTFTATMSSSDSASVVFFDLVQLTLLAPTVTTDNVDTITATSAVGYGTITSNGGDTITAAGLCWSTSVNPTTTDNVVTTATTSGAWSGNITGLTSGTLYHVRAYATNSVGISYGADITFGFNLPAPVAWLSA